MIRTVTLLPHYLLVSCYFSKISENYLKYAILYFGGNFTIELLVIET